MPIQHWSRIRKYADMMQGEGSRFARRIERLPIGPEEKPIAIVGPMGSGKTQIARFIARSLYCHGPGTPLEDPCMDCGACKDSMRAGALRADWLNEIDASQLGSDFSDVFMHVSLRYLFHAERYPEAILMIDEFHRASRSIQNSFIKVLDSNIQITYILVSSAPREIDPAILDRCFTLRLALPSETEVEDWLRRVCGAEEIDADEAAIRRMARETSGRPRAAQKLLSVCANAPGRITGRVVEENLDFIEDFSAYENGGDA